LEIDPKKIFSDYQNKVEGLLSPWAIDTKKSKGRLINENDDAFRNTFQIDRDRIIHTKAFRRLKHKSQVFIAPLGDHYVTRLTHTIEVSQIARTISRALKLNEDLTEAIALGHDLGHSPFGHVGESALDKISKEGFHHSRQSVRIIEKLEKNGNGLNLNLEVIEGIKRHSKPQGKFLNKELVKDLFLEAQIVRISDMIAYTTSDINDAIRANIIELNSIPRYIIDYLGYKHSERVNTLVTNVIENSIDCSYKNSNEPWIRMSDDLIEIITELRNFMFKNVYLPVSDSKPAKSSMKIINLIFDFLIKNPNEVPEYLLKICDGNIEKASIDYITGMTDDFALRFSERFDKSLASDVFEGRL
tara:strand:- start:5698 stop:6774 length:1077 start_codon:yes stop_codon:yes gene_type:complete